MLRAIFKSLKQSRRYAIVAVSLIIALFAGEVTRQYSGAVKRLDDAKLDDRNEYSGTEFCAEPKHFSVGQVITRNQMIDYLRSIDVTKANYEVEGKNKLRLISRKKEFPSAVFTFNVNRLTAISILDPNKKTVPARNVEVEPPVIQTYVWSVRSYGEAEKDIAFAEAISPDNPSRLCVRRRLTEPADIFETSAYYAILAAEDHEFPDTRGMSLRHLVLATVQGRGGSGITQQLVKNGIILDASHSISRKVAEAFLSFAVESRYEKAQIFTMYANGINFGTSADGMVLYGIASAAYEFYGVTPDHIRELSLGKAVTLAAMIKRPNFFLGMSKDDFTPPTHDRVRYADLQERREYVLKEITRYFGDRFSAQEIDEARREPISFVFASQRQETTIEKLSSRFVRYAAANPALNTIAPLTTHSGLRVYTSEDVDLTTIAAQALEALPTIASKHPPVDAETGAPVDDQLLGSVTILDADTGSVLALAGSDAENRSPASLVKVFWTYLGLEKRIITPDSTIPVGGTTCKIGECLAASKNELGYYLLDRIGTGSGADFIEVLTGRRPSEQPKLAIGVGDGVGFSPMEIAHAFAPLISGGSSPKITLLSKAFLNGDAINLPQVEKRRVMNSEPAAETFELMKGALGFGGGKDKGTLRNTSFSRFAVQRSLNVGAKTGSAPNDLWTVSVQKGSRNLVVVVWVGYKNGSSVFANHETVTAKDISGQIWSTVMSGMYKVRPDLF